MGEWKGVGEGGRGRNGGRTGEGGGREEGGREGGSVGGRERGRGREEGRKEGGRGYSVYIICRATIFVCHGIFKLQYFIRNRPHIS